MCTEGEGSNLLHTMHYVVLFRMVLPLAKLVQLYKKNNMDMLVLAKVYNYIKQYLKPLKHQSLGNRKQTSRDIFI